LTLATGALFHLNNATAQTFAINGVWYGHGCEMSQDCTNGTVGILGGVSILTLDSWKFTITGSQSSGTVLLSNNGNNECRVRFNNLTISLSNSNAQITFGNGDVELYGGSVIGAGVGSNTAGIMQPSSQYVGHILLEGMDFTAIGAHPLMTANYYASGHRWTFSRCKFTSGGSILNAAGVGNIGWGTGIVDVIGTDFGGAGTNYKIHREHGCGTIDHELTKIKTSGASDGTTGISHKMVTNANGKWHAPLEGFDIATWNDNSGGSKTATIEFLTDSLTALNNDDIWMELGYLPNSGDTQGSLVNDSISNILASNAAQPISTASWTTTGITNVMKQKLQVTFTPGQKGVVRARVLLAKASTTVYVDPVLSIA